MKKLELMACLLILFSACKKEDTPETTPEVPEASSQVIINEFMASNVACCPDPDGVPDADGVEEYDDWVELYNAGETAVDIGGWYISDKKDNPKKFQIPSTSPAETTIGPGEYLVLWADNQPEQGVLHLDFALNVDGEYIGIFTPEGGTVDETTFGAQTPDVSSGRLPNGSGEWTILENSSPGTAN